MLYLHPVHGKANAFQYFLVLGQSSLKKTFGGKRLLFANAEFFFPFLWEAYPRVSRTITFMFDYPFNLFILIGTHLIYYVCRVVNLILD